MPGSVAKTTLGGIAAPLLLVAGALATNAAEPLFETTLVFPVAPDNKPNYRIPALIETPIRGDLLVFAEKRNDGPGDIGNHDIVLKRSSDQGRTWSAEQLVFDDENRVTTDLTVGIDEMTKRIWLFFLRDKKEYQHFTSDDDGRTWQGPTSIHAQVTRPEWDRLKNPREPAGDGKPPRGRMAIWEQGWVQRYGVGPGHAMIQKRIGKHLGRLIVPARHREDTGGGRMQTFAHCFLSDDHGKSWRLGGRIGPNMSECRLIERADGSVLVVARNETAADAPDNLRHLVAVSTDGGETWSAPRRAEELITPRCHGSLERYSIADNGGRNRLLFSSPASPFRQEEHPYGRYNLTVRASYDEGESWSAGRTIWPHPSSYSDLATLHDGTIGMIYERGPKGGTHYWDELHFARFNLEWLTFGRDSSRAQEITPRLP